MREQKYDFPKNPNYITYKATTQQKIFFKNRTTKNCDRTKTIYTNQIEKYK